MQQQAQGSFDVPVCCVAMAGGAESISISAISRLNCATLTFCRPMSASAPTAQGNSSAYTPQLANYNHCKLYLVFINSYYVPQGSLLCLNYRLLQLRLKLHPLQHQYPNSSRVLRFMLFGCGRLPLR